MDDITKYGKIGWDLDMTLLDGANSPVFWNYILANTYQQEHFIITFRTGRLFDRLWLDLAKANCPLLPLHFRGTFGVPERHYNNFMLGLAGGDEYMFWKGWQCRELGIEVLVDDATMEVWAGCSEYDIDYIHPDSLGFEASLRIARDGEVH